MTMSKKAAKIIRYFLKNSVFQIVANETSAYAIQRKLGGIYAKHSITK